MFANPGDLIKLKYKKNNVDIINSEIIYMYCYENDSIVQLIRITPYNKIIGFETTILIENLVSVIHVKKDSALKTILKRPVYYSKQECELILNELQNLHNYRYDYYNTFNHNFYENNGFLKFKIWRDGICWSSKNKDIGFLGFLKSQPNLKIYLV